MTEKHFDIYLLRCLRALVEESHVTRAAERIGSTQPAMSTMLRRLREIFNDPLLVRTEKGMVPTEHARELADSMRIALDTIDRILSVGQTFDPATAQTSFEVAASESLSFLLMPRLIAAVRHAAPSVQIRTRNADLQRARQSLEEGEIDLLLSFTRTASKDLRFSRLLTQKLVVIAAKSHPLGSKLTLENFLRWPHAYHSIGRTGSVVEVAVDAALDELGHHRTIGVSLPSVISIPAVIACTDFLATTTEGIAREFATVLDLRLFAPVLPLDDVSAGMYWHDRMHQNLPHKWLRQLVREVASGLA